MSKKYRSNFAKLSKRTKSRSDKLVEIELDCIARYGGQAKELESAIGMLRLGDHLGWKPLLLIHSKRTIKKYEEILGITVRDFFEEEGPSAERSVGFFAVLQAKSFWKAVSGDEKVEGKGDISP